MAADEKWYFTKEQLANTPSRKCGYEVDKELSYRQQAANFIQDMGQRLQVTQLCINTAIVYMHRFYVFHSFTHFHRNAMAAAALFLAAKVEEQPRKLEHVIKVAHMCLNREQPQLDTKSEKYLEHAQDLVFNENVLLQTLGFDVAIDHPHTHVVRCCHLVRASKDLAQTSYFMASNSLHLTTMCLQYKPTVVACFCIHLACKWSNWEIPQSNEGKDWFWYVDKTVSLDQLEQLTAEFLVIFDKCPTKLKRKIMSISATQNPSLPPPMTGSLFDTEPRKIRPPDGSQLPQDGPTFHSGVIPGSSGRPPPHHSSHMPGEAVSKPLPDKLHQSSSAPGTSGAPQQRVDYRDYKEKKERERLAQQGMTRESHHATPHMSKSMPSNSGKHGPVPPGMMNKPHHRDHKHPPPMSSGSMRPPNNSNNSSGVTQARDAARREQAISREAAKRESSIQRGGEYMFAPPIRHAEPQPLSEHITAHHGLPTDAPPPIGNHLGSGMNCNASTRKDNQTHDWTSAEIPTNEMDVRHVSRDGKGVPPHVEPSSKRSQQPGFESSGRHGRAPTDHRVSASGSDYRVTKEEVSSNSSMQKIPSEMGDVQRHSYNHKHASAGDRMDHNRHRRIGVNEQFASRSAQSVNEGISERKPNISEIGERKPVDLVDRKQTTHSLSELVDRKPSVPDIDRKPIIADLPERKIEVHSSFSESRHESSSRRQDGSKHQPVQPYHPALMKREIKADPTTVKKEDVEFSGRAGSISRAPPPPPPPVTPPPPVPQQQPLLPQLPLPPSNTAAVPSHHHSQERDRHKSRPRSPSHSHEKPPSQHPTRSRSPAIPPRAKSPVSSAAPPLPSKRSDSPHGKLKSTSVALPPSRNGMALEEKPISRRPETPVNKQDHSAMTIKSETEVSPLKVSGGEKQKSSSSASHSSTPDKSGATVPKESPYPRSKSTRQRTPPSSASKKAPPAPLPEMPITPLSPFGSPPPPTPTTPGSASKLRSTNRHRTSSSSSEPELIPVVKKLDEIAGYENIIRDSKIGIKLPNRVPDIIPPIRDRNKKEESSAAPPVSSGASSRSNSNSVTSVAKELKPPDLIRPFPSQMSDAAKPPSLPDDLGAVAFPESDSTNGTFSRTTIPPPSVASDEANIHSVGVIDISTVEENVLPPVSTVEHHHKSEKKKKKKEHKEHKHKDKDKNREERKHRHKHKDKDKDRHKDKTEGSAPIKITIPKDKINLSSTLEPVGGVGLKLKIQKERLKGSDSTGSSPQSAAPSGGLKIKISKDMIGSFNSSNAVPVMPNNETTPSSSRKRDRSSPRSSELSTPPGPPTKSARLNASTGEQRRGASGSSNYGKQNGVEHHRRGGSHYSTPGNKVVQKLADSHNAYQSKGKSSSGSQP